MAAHRTVESNEAKDQVAHVGEGLFLEAERVFKEQGKFVDIVCSHFVFIPAPNLCSNLQFTEEILSALHMVYQAPLLSALELVDKTAVSHVVSASGRSVYQVIGSSGTPYTCLESSHYCSCPAFTYSVLHKEDHMMCKHHLAVKMSNIMGKTKVVSVSNQQLADMLTVLE